MPRSAAPRPSSSRRIHRSYTPATAPTTSESSPTPYLPTSEGAVLTRIRVLLPKQPFLLPLQVQGDEAPSPQPRPKRPVQVQEIKAMWKREEVHGEDALLHLQPTLPATTGTGCHGRTV
ncbi:uncharacterized protein LOC119281498 isoform X2 [Triticum dicoccoides]|uniref:uncharacterized protein LOC119281498 isoform X2 n=1 Tax=Triticum dicoccoides TaxID=85692 RepID=UPI00188E1545|nr:uncharacterized protein LOC119281498 isoform X2 [Triticum dicoccoides]